MLMTEIINERKYFLFSSILDHINTIYLAER